MGIDPKSIPILDCHLVLPSLIVLRAQSLCCFRLSSFQSNESTKITIAIGLCQSNNVNVTHFINYVRSMIWKFFCSFMADASFELKRYVSEISLFNAVRGVGKWHNEKPSWRGLCRNVDWRWLITCAFIHEGNHRKDCSRNWKFSIFILVSLRRFTCCKFSPI